MTKYNFLELAKTRKTTYEFGDKKIANLDLVKILEAGRWAPSCSNSQPWHFVVVKNEKMIEKLMMTTNYGDFHTDPPVIIAIVLLKKKCAGKGFSCFRGNDSGTFDSHMSVGSAGLNMTFEAKDIGIESCIITPKQIDIKKLLKIEKDDSVPMIIALGYSKEGAFQKKRERNKLSEITSYEFFGGKK